MIPLVYLKKKGMKAFILWFLTEVVLWLVRLTPKRAVQVRALAGGHYVVFLGKVLFSHSTSLPTQVYKWEPANSNAGGNPTMD